MTENLREYLDKIIFHITGNKKNKEDIRCELSDHMENLYFDYMSKGYNTERAEELVISAMGDPLNIAKSFSRITFKRVKRKITKHAVKGVFGLIAVYVLFMGINNVATYRRDHEKYKIFLQGIDDGKVSVTDTLLDQLYSSDYKENDLLKNAIENYCEASKNHHFKKMTVVKNAIILLEEVK